MNMSNVRVTRTMPWSNKPEQDSHSDMNLPLQDWEMFWTTMHEKL
jgi:hypothetical protein